MESKMFDLFLDRSSNRLCNGATRRDFLRVGGLGVLGLSLAGALSREKAFAAEITARQPKPCAKSIIMIYLGGGMAQNDTFDPKPDMPEEVRGKYKAIPTSVSGVYFTELLPKMARVMDKVAIVRSGVHNNISHEVASNWVLSGRFGSPFGDYPGMGAVVAHEMGFAGTVPPYVAVPKNPAFSWELGKSAYLGGTIRSVQSRRSERTQLPRARSWPAATADLRRRQSSQDASASRRSSRRSDPRQ